MESAKFEEYPFLHQLPFFLISARVQHTYLKVISIMISDVEVVGASVSVSGSYGAYSGSLSVNMDAFNSALKSGASFGSKYSSYTVGSNGLNEPISLKLIGMHEVFNAKYWMLLSTYVGTGHCSNSFQRSTVESNILKAMQGYAASKNITASTNPQVVTPLTWPDGTYGLPKASSGCPNSKFTWSEGYRKHDTEDLDSQNSWSSTWHVAGWKARNDMAHYFCIKTTSVVDAISHWVWQPGSYCIYKYKECPKGFTGGYIYWDDEDLSNSNGKWGIVPSGSYGSDTRIDFCCRSDGVPDQDIYLPTTDNFILFPRFQKCQKVGGMKVTTEWFKFDNEDLNNKDGQSAVHPYEGVQSSSRHDIILNFCYYQRS